MRHATIVLNRQIIRLCKGILKAWEQWMEDVERETPDSIRASESPKMKDDEPYDRTVNS